MSEEGKASREEITNDSFDDRGFLSLCSGGVFFVLQTIQTIGQFGQVWKGTLAEREGGQNGYLVAAKTVIEKAGSLDAAQELKAEAVLMALVGEHKHLVSLIGVVTRGDPLIVIVSYCEEGDLLGLLKKRSKEGKVALELKLRFAMHVAHGMKHLADNRFVRNVLIEIHINRDIIVTTGSYSKYRLYLHKHSLNQHRRHEGAS